MLSVVSKYTRLVSVVIRTNKNVGFVSVARRNMSMYFFDDEIKLSAPVTFDRSNREVSQIDTTDIDSTMMNDIDEFGDNCELMGSNEHHGFRWVILFGTLFPLIILFYLRVF
jgi:hypothetical protein